MTARDTMSRTAEVMVNKEAGNNRTNEKGEKSWEPYCLSS